MSIGRQLYDVTEAIGHVNRFRQNAADPVARAQIHESLQVADLLARHFPDPDERRVAGIAILIAGGFTVRYRHVPGSVVSNILGLAGTELITGDPGCGT